MTTTFWGDTIKLGTTELAARKLWRAGRQSALTEKKEQIRSLIINPIEKLLCDLDAEFEKHKDHSLDWAIGFGELNILIENFKKEFPDCAEQPKTGETNAKN